MRISFQTTALLLTAAIVGAAELKIDHVTVAGTDLKAMQAHLASVGIASEFGGPHSNGATQMAVASFPDGSYLELIALQESPNQKALAEHYWSKQMQGDAGPAGWAVRSRDVTAEVARLKAAGIAVSAPSHSGRQRPDGVRLDWETARVGEEPNGTFFPFLIRDISPRDARAFPSGKPTNRDFPGVKRLVIAVRDLEASVARYRKAFALAAPPEQDDASFGARLASFEGTPVVLAMPLSPRSWVAKRIEQFGEGPCAFVLGSGGARHQAASTSRWFGVDVSWFDPQKLGWHLGFEK
jgi:hypothetical protein